MSKAERAGYAAIFAWTAFASVWIGYEWLEQRTIVRSVQVVRDGAASADEERSSLEFLSRRDEEAVAYLIQELSQDEWRDPDLRLAWAARKLLDGRAWPIRRRGGRKVAMGFFQRRALKAQLAEWRSRGEHTSLCEKLSAVLGGASVGTEPLSSAERANLELVAEAWRRMPAFRDLAPKLEQLLEGETLEEIKLTEAEDTALRELAAALEGRPLEAAKLGETLKGLDKAASASAAGKLLRLLGSPRKGTLELRPEEARVLAGWGGHLREINHTRVLGEKVGRLAGGEALETLSLTPDEERELRAFARNLIASYSEGPELTLGRKLVERFGSLAFCDVGLSEEDMRILRRLEVSARQRHLAKRRRLSAAIRRIVEDMATRGHTLSRVPQGDLVRLMAEDDEPTRRELAAAFAANWLGLRKRLKGIPEGDTTAKQLAETELRRARNWLLSAAERRSANQTMITTTDDRTREEQATFLNRRNHLRRLEAIRLLLEYGEPEDIAKLSSLVAGDPDVDYYVRRGMLAKSLGTVEPLRHVLFQRTSAFLELFPPGDASSRFARSVLEFGIQSLKAAGGKTEAR